MDWILSIGFLVCVYFLMGLICAALYISDENDEIIWSKSKTKTIGFFFFWPIVLVLGFCWILLAIVKDTASQILKFLFDKD